MTLDEAIHQELDLRGQVTWSRRRELAAEYKTKIENVTDEVRGAYRQRADDISDRLRIRAELDAAKKMARERVQVIATMDGKSVTIPTPDIPSLVRAIVADAQVCGLMTQKAAKEAGHSAAPPEPKTLNDKRRLHAEMKEYLMALEAEIKKESTNGATH